ncbi:MAG: lysozyme [Hydrococcus sp. SU_1_0]|nr:lysozyme [Hydrococcus sp. SU_1_0]
MIGSGVNKPIVSSLSPAGLDLIKGFEGLRLNAYQCSAGKWTIGYGHTKTAKSGQCITHSQALRLLTEDVAQFEQAVRTTVQVPLTQNQFDALVSFCYNVGSTAFRNSHLVSALNRGYYSMAAKELYRWVFAGKVKIPGLVRRREQEYALFMKKDE